MSKIIGGPVTQAERSAVPAKDLYKGMDCKGFDPEKSDHIHGRAGAPSLLFSVGRGFDASQFCPFCEKRWVWCLDPEEHHKLDSMRLEQTAGGFGVQVVFPSAEASC